MSKVLKKDLTKEQEKLVNITKDIAVEMTGNQDANAEQLFDEIATDLKSTKPNIKSRAVQRAGDFTAKLVLMLYYQDIEEGLTNSKLGKYSWVNRFDSGFIREGNSIQLIQYLNTGNGEFEEDKFIPDKRILPQIEEKTISMYEVDATGNKVLSKNGYQYKKALTLQQSLWIPYFIKGNLMTFVERIRSSLNVSFDLFKINKVESFITALTLPTVTPSAEALDLFTCLTNDVFPAVEKMQYLNKEFNLDNASNVIVPADKSKLIMLVHQNLYTKLAAGIQSRTFNSQLIGLDSVINKENIIPVQGSVNPAGMEDVFTIGADWLAEDEIIVMETDAIKHYMQIDTTATQAYAENLTIMLYLHRWGVIDFVPWGKAFKYKNENLKKLPA